MECTFLMLYFGTVERVLFCILHWQNDLLRMNCGFLVGGWNPRSWERHGHYSVLVGYFGVIRCNIRIIYIYMYIYICIIYIYINTHGLV